MLWVMVTDVHWELKLHGKPVGLFCHAVMMREVLLSKKDAVFTPGIFLTTC